MTKLRTLIFILTLIGSIAFGQDLTANFNYFPKTEYNAKIVANTTDDNGINFEKIVLDGFDSKIPFYLIKPKDKKENKSIILLHGLTGNKDEWTNPMTNFGKLKDSLLILGYSVIIPDAKYHGERSYEANFASPLTFFASQDAHKVYNLFTTTVKDIRIIMDYIQSSSDNTLTTFDILGYSMGGILGIFLNSCDDRLHRVVACVPGLDSQKSSKVLGMHEEHAKKLAFISPKNFSTLQKAPITLLMGTQDVYYLKEEAQDFFENITIKDKTLKFYNSGHTLPEEFISDALKALNKK